MTFPPTCIYVPYTKDWSNSAQPWMSNLTENILSLCRRTKAPASSIY